MLDLRSGDLGPARAHTSRPPLYLLWQIRGGIAPGTLFQAALVARMLRYGAELWIAMLLLILLGRIGFWIVSWQLGEEALGLYFGSQRLGEILVEVATAVGIVIFSYGVRATGHPRLRPGRDPHRPAGHGADGAGGDRGDGCWHARC